METVKVDIQKLQLLNDRIAQTIEALNQVRLSVHGIQHTSAPIGFSQFGGASPWAGVGYGGYSQLGYGQPGFAQPGYGQPGFGQAFSPFVGGLSHTTSPWTSSPYGGIAHSSIDPMWQMRAAQAFPFAQVQVSPFVY